MFIRNYLLIKIALLIFLTFQFYFDYSDMYATKIIWTLEQTITYFLEKSYLQLRDFYIEFHINAPLLDFAIGMSSVLSSLDNFIQILDMILFYYSVWEVHVEIFEDNHLFVIPDMTPLVGVITVIWKLFTHSAWAWGIICV